MTHVDEHDLERELTATFERAAARTPLPAPVWRGPEQVTEPSGRSVRTLIAAAAAVALVAGGVIAVAATVLDRQPDVRSVATAAVEPPPTDPPPPTRGTELSFAPAEATPDLADTFEPLGSEPIRPGSLVAATFEGYPVVFYTTITASSSGLIEMRCGAIGPEGNGACTPVSQAGSNHSQVPGAGGAVWFWLGVPARTTYARASIAGEALWERPIGNAAVFPASDDPDDHFAPWPVLGDAGIPTDTSLPTPAEAASSTGGGQLPVDVRDAAPAAVRTTAKACLDDAGFGDPFETLDPAIVTNEVWNRCVQEAADALDALLADVAEPASERPQNVP